MKEARHKAVETLFDIKDRTRISAELWNPHALSVLDLADQYDRLREALREIIALQKANPGPLTLDDYEYIGYEVCADIARAALREGKE